jgi:hypothetical protein
MIANIFKKDMPGSVHAIDEKLAHMGETLGEFSESINLRR